MKQTKRKMTNRETNAKIKVKEKEMLPGSIPPTTNTYSLNL